MKFRHEFVVFLYLGFKKTMLPTFICLFSHHNFDRHLIKKIRFNENTVYFLDIFKKNQDNYMSGKDHMLYKSMIIMRIERSIKKYDSWIYLTLGHRGCST